MSRLPLLTIENAPDAAKAGLQTAQINNGFLPNLVRLLANAPTALKPIKPVSAINAQERFEPGRTRGRADHGGGNARMRILASPGIRLSPTKRPGFRRRWSKRCATAERFRMIALNAVADFTRAVIREPRRGVRRRGKRRRFAPPASPMPMLWRSCSASASRHCAISPTISDNHRLTTSCVPTAGRTRRRAAAE